MPEGVDTLKVAQALHVAMGRERDLLVGVDFIVTTPSRFETHKDSLGNVCPGCCS